MHITTAINTTMKCTYIDRAYEFSTVTQDDQNLVKVKPCCYAHWNLIPEGVRSPMQVFETNERVTNNPVIEWFRDTVKSGKLPRSCKTCTTTEAAGGRSPRLDSLEYMDPDHDIFMLDVHTGNECNLACAMCNVYSSSLIEKESVKYDDTPAIWKHTTKYTSTDHDSDATFNQLDQIMKSKRVQIVKFKGGEPLLKRNWTHIERGLESGQYADTIIRIITNGTNLNKNIIEKLHLARKATINVSVDGIGEVGEFVRWPQTADKIQRTLDIIHENRYSNVHFNTTTIVTMLNIGDIENIHRECSRVAEQVTFDFDLKPEGHPLDYRNIPNSIRSKLRNSIDPAILHKGSLPLRNLIDIEHEGWTNPLEVERTLSWFEKHRGKEIKNVLHPEVYKWYLSI